MPLVWYAFSTPQSGVHTTMSEGGLVVMAIVAMISLAALLIPVNLASRAPRRPGPAFAPPGSVAVAGSLHPGDGRSVAPHQDEPAVPSGQQQAVPAPAAREGEGTAGQG